MSLRSPIRPAALALLLAGIGQAGAVEFHHGEAPFVPVHHCTCRIDGQEVDLGERRCLKTADGPRSAVCTMEQNVTSWKPSGETCPEASLATPRG